MPYENYQEYQRDQLDEAKQAAKELAKELGRYTHKKVSGGYDYYDTISGETHHASDYSPSDEDCGDDEEGEE
jgi:hypothetical protein